MAMTSAVGDALMQVLSYDIGNREDHHGHASTHKNSKKLIIDNRSKMHGFKSVSFTS